MKKYTVYFLSAFILALVQAAFLDELFEAFAPGMLLSLVILLLRVGRKADALFFAFVSGIFLDMFWGNTLGITSMFYIGFVFVCSLLFERVSRNVFTYMFFVLVAQCLYALFFVVTMHYPFIWGRIAVSGVVTSVISVILLSIYRTMFGLKQSKYYEAK